MFESSGIAMSINWMSLDLLLMVMISGLLWVTRLSVCTGKFQRIFTVSFSKIGSGSYWCHLTAFGWTNSCFSAKRRWIYRQTLSWRCVYLVGARAGHPEMTWWIVSGLDLQARQVSSFDVLWMCFFVYFVVIAFSCIAHIVDSVARLSVDDRSQEREVVLSIWGWSSELKNWPCMGLDLTVSSFLLLRVVFTRDLSCWLLSWLDCSWSMFSSVRYV